MKRALLDQSLISGVGNIYADEALWRARLHWRAADRDADQARGARACWPPSARSWAPPLRAGGTSFDSLYVNVNGESGYFDRSLDVYGRRDEPCPRCGDADPPRRVHEPVLLQLPPLPAAPPPGVAGDRGRRSSGSVRRAASAATCGLTWPSRARRRPCSRCVTHSEPQPPHPNNSRAPRSAADRCPLADQLAQAAGPAASTGCSRHQTVPQAERRPRIAGDRGAEPDRLTAWVRGRVQGVGFPLVGASRALELGPGRLGAQPGGRAGRGGRGGPGRSALRQAAGVCCRRRATHRAGSTWGRRTLERDPRRWSRGFVER